MPPVVDVQTYRPIVEVAEAPWLVGATAMQSFGLLSASDGDETWSVSGALTDVVPYAGAKLGRVTLSADVPLRAEWNSQVGIADPRLSFAWDAWRVGVVAPVGTMRWPFSWEDWRVEVTETRGNDLAKLSAGISYGENGLLARGRAGVRLGTWSLEALFAKSWGALPLLAGEVMATYTRGAVSQFVSVGVLPGAGSPQARVGMDVRWAYRKPTPPPPPPVVEAPPAPSPAPPPPEPVIAVAPPPPPPVVEVAPPPPPVVRKVRRLRVEVHSDCRGTRKEAMARSRAELKLVAAKLVEAGFARDSMDLVPMGCKKPLVYPETNKAARSQNRRVEVTVVEVDEVVTGTVGGGLGAETSGTGTPTLAQ